MICIFGGGD